MPPVHHQYHKVVTTGMTIEKNVCPKKYAYYQKHSILCRSAVTGKIKLSRLRDKQEETDLKQRVLNYSIQERKNIFP